MEELIEDKQKKIQQGREENVLVILQKKKKMKMCFLQAMNTNYVSVFFFSFLFNSKVAAFLQVLFYFFYDFKIADDVDGFNI